MSAVQITDHQGNKVFHGRVLANGVRLHYITAGSGAPLLLLHGVPKTSFYWYRIIPLLTPHFTIVAPDIRGFGDSAKPHGGYDMKTIPVLAISSQYFMKEEPLRQMQQVAANIEYVELERCGHSMALEQPEKLAATMLEFFRR
jgi:pimeloyl-ACP methyl ester carboxylesterase